MASHRVAVVAFILMGILAMSQLSAAAVKKNCGKDLIAPFRPCIKSVIGDRPPPPDAACCRAVKNADLDCTCKAFTSLKPTKPGKLPAGVKPNIKAAFALPKKCKRSIPKNYKCNGIKF